MLPGRYVHIRRRTRTWMGKNREQNIAGEMLWPWTAQCLSETNWSLWKVLCIGKKGESGAMTFKEEGRYALYKIWEQLNLGVAEESTWTLGSTGGRSGGHVSGTGCKFWCTPLDELPLNSRDKRRFAEYRSPPPSLLAYGETISGGGKPPSTWGKDEGGRAGSSVHCGFCKRRTHHGAKSAK